MKATLFCLLALYTLVSFYYATGKNNKLWWSFGSWTVIVSLLGWQGFYEQTDAFPPRMAFILLPVIVLCMYLFRQIQAEKTDLRFLTAVHIVRIPVELFLYQLFLEKSVPKIMTYAGWNWDILMGITAIPVLIYLVVKKDKASKLLLQAWNILGIIMLTIIVLTAILSIPSPFQQLAFEQPNTGVLSFPYILLPATIVPLVYLSHFLALKKIKPGGSWR
jgi:hypothetical protein